MAVKKRFPYQAAFVACNGGCRATADCQYGCVGCELCVNACKFEAIALNDYGVAEVNEDNTLVRVRQMYEHKVEEAEHQKENAMHQLRLIGIVQTIEDI